MRAVSVVAGGGIRGSLGKRAAAGLGIFLGSAPWLVLAAVTNLAPRAQAQPQLQGGIFDFLLENAVGLTILFIFVVAIVGAILNARRRDRVLKDFNEYHVTAVLQDDRRVWGQLVAFPNGIEMRYRQPYRNAAGNIHNSFVLYQSEYPAVRAILRLESDLTPENRQRRLDELLRYANPSLPRRLLRWMLKQFAALRDAFVQSLAVLIGQAKKVAPTRTTAGMILTTQDQRLTSLGSTLLGSVHLLNDPILERKIGRWCVAEVKDGEGWREIPGILKEYSADWLEMLEASWPRRLEIHLQAGETEREVPESHFRIRREPGRLSIDNDPPEGLEILECAVEGMARPLTQRHIPPGETVYVDLGDKSEGNLSVHLIVMEPADVILPRSVTVLRHAGRREQISWLQAMGLRRRPSRRKKRPVDTPPDSI